MAHFRTMGERIWWAWRCLPRDERGESPEWRDLERKVGLSNGTLHKLAWDITTGPRPDTLEKVSRALDTTVEWLHLERGEGPVARGPMPDGGIRPAAPPGAAKRSKHRKKSGPMPSVKVAKG